MVLTGRMSGVEDTLRKQLEQARAATKQKLSSDDITTIIREVVGSLEGDVTASDLKFYKELRALADYIRDAKAQIASIKPKEIGSDFIPKASDELDAVVGATEEATNKIMDVCDEISTFAATLSPEANERLVGFTTRIFEACNFQDITGQRITKVVHTLKHIDVKVEALISALGEEISHVAEAEKPAENRPLTDDDLLNGPQMPGQGVNQDDIDKLFD
jgi:chemotaxis protein CheZ